MHTLNVPSRHRGFTLIELVVTAAIFALVFGGLFTSVQFTLKLIGNSKARTSALALAAEQIEYIRSLPYNSVGTVSGIPSGPIPQYSTSSLNGVTLHERVLIQYVDSPDDGTGASDSNGILADYKQAKVEYSWAGINGTSTIFLLTNVVPPGIESSVGGGTLTVNVFDADVLPLSGADVRIYNNTTTSTIDVTTHTNASGIAMFSGAPAAANYQITVSDAGYSTDQTYTATTSNPNPSTPHVAVLEGAVSTMNFQIDELSDLLVRTIGTPMVNSFADTFPDTSMVGASANVDVALGDVVLQGGPGAYVPLGSIYATATSPGAFTAWNTAQWTHTAPANTTLTMQVFAVTATGSYALIPDGDLPGNGAGFSASPIDLSALNTTTYSSIALGAQLTSSDVNATPLLHDWQIEYTVSEPALGSIPFTLWGSKVIGTTASATPIYKYHASHTTDAGGEIELNNMEWDAYTVVLDTGAYDIKEACPGIPYALDPGVSETLKLTLAASTAFSLRVETVDIDGDPIIGATIELSRSGFSETETSSSCGQAFFNTGLGANPDYQVLIQAPGFVDQTISDVNISGAESLRAVLTAV